MSSSCFSSSDEDACDIGLCGIDEPDVPGGGGARNPGNPSGCQMGRQSVDLPDPSPLSTTIWPESTCSCLSEVGGTRGCPLPAPRPGCLRAPLLTPRAPQSAAQGTSARYSVVKECIPKYRRWRPYTSG
ncbi:hypothetical protein M9H77_21492 [Catharanthus roseus]|uniref:Uncharacterized protein n=1 Tax=Catharanthus roseus TaxID=4058 RepID=A0ACC0AMV1_CATRO|nr:hypothetical protein M9H77_21492 [Catharanthus roseus]